MGMMESIHLTRCFLEAFLVEQFGRIGGVLRNSFERSFRTSESELSIVFTFRFDLPVSTKLLSQTIERGFAVDMEKR